MTTSDLVDGVKAGNPAAIARVISRSEQATGLFDPDIAALYRNACQSHIVGVTGPPGSGKSTLVDALARHLRSRDASVGVLAIDPTSPLSGGALLGDRIRMAGLTEDPEVFVRSMANRGKLGGLAPAVADAATALAVSGRDTVIIETVGVGQDEVEVAQAAHTTIVVSVPGLGDDVQTMKAGLLEIADIHVVNKTDLPGADRVIADLRDMLGYQEASAEAWVTPVLAVSAEYGTGIGELGEVIGKHHAWLASSGELESRQRAITEQRIQSAIVDLIVHRMNRLPAQAMAEAIDAVRSRASDPFTVAQALLESTFADSGDGG
jgi:LAO/AO transport system kinase